MPTILIVDDDADNRHILSHLLRYWGHSVVTAIDGMDGVTVALAIHPDLILMDLNMPRSNGWTAIQHLQRQPETADIPVLLMTADIAVDNHRARNEHGVRYILKPINFAKLERLLAAVGVGVPTTSKTFSGNTTG